MKNVEQMFGEVSKRLRQIAEKNCCQYNSSGHAEITDSGTDTYTFAAGTVNSIAWYVESGTVDITMGGVTLEYATAGTIGFSTLNASAITFTVVTGTTKLQWIY